MCEEMLNQFTMKQESTRQVTVVVDLENASFAKFHIAERSHLSTESTTAYVKIRTFKPTWAIYLRHTPHHEGQHG